MRPALLAAAAALVAAPLHAQLGPRLSAGAGGSSVRVTSVTPSGTARLSGIGIGATGRVGGRRLALEVAYRQSSLTADSGTAPDQDLAEGRLMVAGRPASWVTLLAGPHARAFVRPGGTERWMLMEARVRARGTTADGAILTTVELWTSLGGSVNAGSGSPGGRGGEVGLTIRVPRSPVWLRLAYTIDRTTQSGGGNVRTVEDLGLSVGLGH